MLHIIKLQLCRCQIYIIEGIYLFFWVSNFILFSCSDEYCQNDVQQPDIDSNSQKSSSPGVTPPAENMNKKPASSSQRGNKCSKCLTNQKTITKCKQKCCTTPPFHRECPNTDSRPHKIAISKQEGTTKGKCKLNIKQIAKRCKKCQIGITRCNGKYKRMCPDCCPGKNILEKCKPRRGRRKKGRKSKGKTNNKSGSQKNKKFNQNLQEANIVKIKKHIRHRNDKKQWITILHCLCN